MAMYSSTRKQERPVSSLRTTQSTSSRADMSVWSLPHSRWEMNYTVAKQNYTVYLAYINSTENVWVNTIKYQSAVIIMWYKIMSVLWKKKKPWFYLFLVVLRSEFRISYLARQALYHLSNTFALVIFLIGLCFVLGWP
jgi:hypothetical protein